MTDSIDINDIITLNRNMYGTEKPKQEIKIINKPADDSSMTIDNILRGNQAFYTPLQIQQSQQAREQIAEVSEEEKDKQDFFKDALKLTKIPEIISLNLIYNYKTIFRNDGIPYDEVKNLDATRTKRKEREQQASGTSQNREPINVKKQYVRLYKNSISKLCFIAPKELILISKNLSTNQKWEKHLKLQDFGNLKPSLSIVQEKTTGRFYIYDNKYGKVHIYSYDMLINENKDKPLVSLNLNEDKPRQDPLLYLIECEHEYQWKSVLFVIGGHHLQRGEKRPLRTIKVFEIKRREVTLTPVLTITMTKPRMNPIVFDLIKDKGIIWQDRDTNDKERINAIDNKYIFFFGGNPLSEYEKEAPNEYKEANQTCEYISLKLVLEHIARAKLFNQTDQGNLGLNFGKFSIFNTLTIKYQNTVVTERLYNHFYNASLTKMVDDVFQHKSLIIIGGNTTQTFLIQTISFKMNEITLIGQNKQIPKPSLIYSASNLRYLEKKVAYFDDSCNKEAMMLLNMDSRRDVKTSCACLIM